MKLLYVDAAVETINPTANWTPHLVCAAADEVAWYGPNLCSRETLAGGLERHVCETGPYDAVVFGPNTPILDGETGIERTVAFCSRSAALGPPADILDHFFRDVLECIARLPVRLKLISLLNFDYYAASQAQVDKIQDLGLTLIGPNDQFVIPLGALPDYAADEHHFKRKRERLSDAFHDYIASHPGGIVTAVHFVQDSEFFYRHWDERDEAVAVPGIEYVLRTRAIRSLKQSGRKIASKTAFHLYRAGNRLGLPVYSRHLPLKFYNLSFQYGLLKARIVYTARGGFGIPIRKFFEIPASGALMICSPPNGASDLGFRDGETCIVSPPEILEQTLSRLDADPLCADIALAGQAMVRTCHSLQARAGQLRRCLDALAAGAYRGSRWKAGEFVVETTG